MKTKPKTERRKWHLESELAELVLLECIIHDYARSLDAIASGLRQTATTLGDIYDAVRKRKQ